jgi:hypothetical protein
MLLDPHARGRALFAGTERHWVAFLDGPQKDATITDRICLQPEQGSC